MNAKTSRMTAQSFDSRTQPTLSISPFHDPHTSRCNSTTIMRFHTVLARYFASRDSRSTGHSKEWRATIASHSPRIGALSTRGKPDKGRRRSSPDKKVRAEAGAFGGKPAKQQHRLTALVPLPRALASEPASPCVAAPDDDAPRTMSSVIKGMCDALRAHAPSPASVLALVLYRIPLHEARAICKLADMLKGLALPTSLYCREFANPDNPKQMPRVAVSRYIARLVVNLNAAVYDDNDRCVVVDALSDGLRCILFGMELLCRTGIIVTEFNMHRLCATSMYVAHQVLEDTPVTLQWFAQVAGIPPKQFASMQAKFCQHANYRLTDTHTVFLTDIHDAVLSDETGKPTA